MNMDDHNTTQHEYDEQYLDEQDSYQIESFHEGNEMSGQLMATYDKVLQFRKEIECIDEMLLNTNTINLDELRSACRLTNESESKENTQEGLLNKIQTSYRMQGEMVGVESRNALIKISSKKTTSNKRYQQFDSDEEENLVKDQNMNKNLDQGYQTPSSAILQLQSGFKSEKTPDLSFDIQKIKEAKQLKIQEAFEQNLRSKKQEILRLEDEQLSLQRDQEGKLIQLSHLKNQREFYQSQFQTANNKRKIALTSAKDGIKRIDNKMKEYRGRYTEKSNSLSQQIIEIQKQIQSLKDEERKLDQKLQTCPQKPEINVRNSQELINSKPEIDEMERDLQLKIRIKAEEVTQLGINKIELELNLKYMQDFLRQTNEEMLMTLEDIDAKVIKKAELVAQREELDQMYDCGKFGVGKEFELFIKLKEVSQAVRQSSTQFIYQEYEQIKAQTFFNDLVSQMKSLAQNEEQYKYIERQQQLVKQKACILEPKEIIKIIGNLSTQLEMEIDEATLMQKYVNSSQEKDSIYEKRRGKLQDIMKEVKFYEQRIMCYHNTVENMLRPQSQAISQTFHENTQKVNEMKQLHTVLSNKKQTADLDLAKLKEQYSMCSQQQVEISTIQEVTEELLEVQDEVQRGIAMLENLIQHQAKLDEDYQNMLQKLTGKKKVMRLRHSQYDPLNATGTSNLSNTLSLNGALDGSNDIDIEQQKSQNPILEDEHIRKVLDGIDIKIGQAIEEKEQDCIKLHVIQRQIAEAKDSFTSAYKSYKAIKMVKNNKTHYKQPPLPTIKRQLPPIQSMQGTQKPKQRERMSKLKVMKQLSDEVFKDDISQTHSYYSQHQSNVFQQYQDLNNQLITKGGIMNEMSNNLPAYVFSSERKPAIRNQFVSYSQYSDDDSPLVDGNVHKTSLALAQNQSTVNQSPIQVKENQNKHAQQKRKYQTKSRSPNKENDSQNSNSRATSLQVSNIGNMSIFTLKNKASNMKQKPFPSRYDQIISQSNENLSSNNFSRSMISNNQQDQTGAFEINSGAIKISEAQVTPERIHYQQYSESQNKRQSESNTSGHPSYNHQVKINAQRNYNTVDYQRQNQRDQQNSNLQPISAPLVSQKDENSQNQQSSHESKNLVHRQVPQLENQYPIQVNQNNQMQESLNYRGAIKLEIGQSQKAF